MKQKLPQITISHQRAGVKVVVVDQRVRGHAYKQPDGLWHVTIDSAVVGTCKAAREVEFTVLSHLLRDRPPVVATFEALNEFDRWVPVTWAQAAAIRLEGGEVRSSDD